MRTTTILVIILSSLWAYSQPSDSLNKLDERNRKQGIWKKKYPNGVVRYRGLFTDDKPVGEFRYYTEEGRLKSIVAHAGDGIHSTITIFDDQRKIQGTGFYAGQKKDSLWVLFDGKGNRVAEERYQNGNPQGVWITFYPSDSVPAQVQHWREGRREGALREYFPSGKLKHEQFYVNDRAEGVVKSWYPDGTLILEGVYTGGEMDGEWKYYTKEGKLKRRVVFDAGKMVEEEILIKDDYEEAAPLPEDEDPAVNQGY